MNQQQTEEKVIGLLRREAQKYLRLPGVTSVGVGYKIKDGKRTEQLSIQFTVEKKKSVVELESASQMKLPESFRDLDGTEVPTDVIERTYEPSVVLVAEREELAPRKQRRRKMDPVRPGISVAHKAVSAGTLGAVVFDRDTGTPLLMSNWHVLHGAAGNLGDDILQPGPFDGGDAATARVGKLLRSHLGLAGDCAVASIEGRGVNRSMLELDVTPMRIGKVNLGDRLVKSGRTTGVTYGIVRRVGVVAKIDYGGAIGEQEIGGFEIGPNPEKPAEEGEISKGGDSGSVWMMDDTGELRDLAVGLHFAGESTFDPDEHALACNLHSVLEKLNVALVPPLVPKRPGKTLEIGELRPPVPLVEAEEDLPPLTLEQLEIIEQRLATQPKETLERLRSMMDETLTLEEARSMLAQARSLLRRPGALEAAIAVPEVSLEAVVEALPPDFNFPGMDLARIPIDPDNRQFEDSDLLRWIALAGPGFLANLFGFGKAPFREADDFPSQFEYTLPEPTPQHPLEVALFSDFGTGLYYARYIAKQFDQKRFPLAFHLGDVYYAGRKSEFQKHFREPLDPILAHTELFLLNSNHEMYSGGKWYFRFIEDKRNAHSGRQRQEGSYFSLASERFQIVGIDTNYHEEHRFPKPELRDWLRTQLGRGRAAGRMNILLSADQPYKYGEQGLSDLVTSDLRSIIIDGLVDIWFWGNTHYCALFDLQSQTPFVGSCIGHAGFPYARQDAGKHEPAPVRFLEDLARFPASTKIRQDRGNNGYCVMSLHHDGTIRLRYIDWMTNERWRGRIERPALNQPPHVVPEF